MTPKPDGAAKAPGGKAPGGKTVGGKTVARDARI